MALRLRYSDKLGRLIVYCFRYKGISYKWNETVGLYKSLDNNYTMSKKHFLELFDAEDEDLQMINIGDK